MNLTRRDFEIMITRVDEPTIPEFVIYDSIAIAPRHIQVLKEPYRFLADPSIPDAEKKWLLRPVYV